ncbi:addiction module toxin RelE [Helicobacter sp. 12S02634-8]|uniref:type II toxin-antitoxin system YafQ family toxin n=1 Tax=Helicobacter sp. 12S02634-8 TaxID=1476199 RepID=UPI000BA778F4|nr:type II toxin-antitoxin system YafQ family toxin [Helicobacter sp. 12S02634-8]PAF46855.1 addiction module toxin RelE [Helicobacter sp. 12S02634-8]
MKYSLAYAKVFAKEYKKLSPKNQELVDGVLEKLGNGETLEAKHKDHQLKGVLKDFRECHIKPDLLLVYAKQEDVLILTALRVGSHSKLFKS